MNWWKVLDIPYDSDLKTIKKAYAKLLKIHNPEDDPEGYQKLRQAYDTAIKYVKNTNLQDSLIDLFEDINDEVSILENEDNIGEEVVKKQYQNTYNSYDLQNNKDINLKIEEFFGKLNEIYNNNSLKNDLGAWEELLNNDVVWNVYSSPIIEDYIFEFLLKHEDLLLNIWYILNYHFNWVNKEESLYEKYDVQSVERFLKVIRNINYLKYEHIKEINATSIENYLSLCKQGYSALKSKDYYEAQKSLLAAYELFSKDEELLKLLGDFYYEVGDLENSLKFYKSAFEIDNSDLKLALSIGTILGNMDRFTEALIYTQLYFASNSEDVSALNNMACSCYFTGDLVNAKEYFERLLKFKPNSKIIKKCLKNIDAKLEGKNVKTLKLRKYKPKKKKIIKRDPEASMKKGRIKTILILLILAVIVFRLTISFGTRANNNDTKKNPELHNRTDKLNQIPDEDETVFKTIKARADLRKVEYYINLRIYLDDIKPTDYYKISGEFNGNKILSKKEIENNKLEDKIESKLYIGLFDTGAIAFTDKNYKEGSQNKNHLYKLEGAMCAIEGETYKGIKEQYKAQNQDDKDWAAQIYIDCAPKEIERLRKLNESLEIHDGKRLKVVKTLQEFKESNYEALHSIYLKNIIPLNIYVTVDKNGKFDFYKKEELNKEDSTGKTYTKAFVGQIDEKNVMFIDSSFSIDKLDSNKGYTINGYKYNFKIKDPIKLPIENGQSGNLVIIEPCFLYNTDLKN